MLQHVRRTEAEAEQLARRDPRVAAALDAPRAPGVPLLERVAAYALVTLYRYGYRCGWDGIKAAAHGVVAYGGRQLAEQPEALLRGVGDGLADGLVLGGHAVPEDEAPAP